MSSTSGQPISGLGIRRTCAWSALATSWPPRQTPISGTSSADQALQEKALVAQPAVPVLLVDVHRAAEDEHGAVVLERRRRLRRLGDQPLVELVPALGDRVGEDARRGVGLVDDGEDPHGLSLTGWRTHTFGSQ